MDGSIETSRSTVGPKPRLAPKPFSLQKNNTIRSIHAPRTVTATSKLTNIPSGKPETTSVATVAPATAAHTPPQQTTTADSKPTSLSVYVKDEPKTAGENQHREDPVPRTTGVPKAPSPTTTAQTPPQQTAAADCKPSPVSEYIKDEPKTDNERKESKNREDTSKSTAAPAKTESHLQTTSAPKVTPYTLGQKPSQTSTTDEPSPVSEHITCDLKPTSPSPHTEDTPTVAPQTRTPKAAQKNDVTQTNHKAPAAAESNSEQKDSKTEEDKTSVIQKPEEPDSVSPSAANPAYHWGGTRRRLSSKLTSKFESSDPPVSPQPTLDASTTSNKDNTKKPVSSSPEQSQATPEPSRRASDEGEPIDYSGGDSIKRRISQLFETSLRPEAVTKKEEPDIKTGSGGVKERIKNWVTDTSGEDPKPQVVSRARSKSVDSPAYPVGDNTPKRADVPLPSTQAVPPSIKDSAVEQPTEAPVEATKQEAVEKPQERTADMPGEQEQSKSVEPVVTLRLPKASTDQAAMDEGHTGSSESPQPGLKRNNAKRRSVRFGIVETDDGAPPLILGSPSDSSSEEDPPEDKGEGNTSASAPVYRRVGASLKKDGESQKKEEEHEKQAKLEKNLKAEENKQTRLKLEEERKQKDEERENEITRHREELRRREEERQEEMEKEIARQREELRRREEERQRQEEMEKEVARQREELRHREEERQRQEEMEKEITRQREELRRREEERQRQEEMEKEIARQREELRRREEERQRQEEMEKEIARQREELRRREEEKQRQEEMEKQRLKEEEVQRQEEEWERGRLKEEEQKRQMELLQQRQIEEERQQIKRKEQEEREKEKLREDKEQQLEEMRQKEEMRARQMEERLRLAEMEIERLRKEAEERERENRRRLEEEEEIKARQRQEERRRIELEIRIQREKEEEKEIIRQIEKQREEERKKQLEKEQVEEIKRKMHEEEERKRLKELEDKLRMEEAKKTEKEASKLISFGSEDVPHKSETLRSSLPKPFEASANAEDIIYDDFSVKKPRVDVDFEDFSVKPRRWGLQPKVETAPARNWRAELVDENVEVLVVHPKENKAPEKVVEPDRPESVESPEEKEEEEEQRPVEEQLSSVDPEQEEEEKESPDEEDMMEDESDDEEAQVNSYCVNPEDKDTDALIDTSPDQQNGFCEQMTQTDSPKSVPEHAPEVSSEDVDPTDSTRQPDFVPFPESSTPLLDNSAQRSKVALRKSQIRRAPSRSLRLAQTESQSWRVHDSTDEKNGSTKQEDSEPEAKQPKLHKASSPSPGLNPAAQLIEQLRRRTSGGGAGKGEAKEDVKQREENESQHEDVAPTPTPLSRSPRNAAQLAGAALVLPPLGSSDGGAASSPAWLKELKSKKRLSHHDSET